MIHLNSFALGSACFSILQGFSHTSTEIFKSVKKRFDDFQSLFASLTCGFFPFFNAFSILYSKFFNIFFKSISNFFYILLHPIFH